MNGKCFSLFVLFTGSLLVSTLLFVTMRWEEPQSSKKPILINALPTARAPIKYFNANFSWKPSDCNPVDVAKFIRCAHSIIIKPKEQENMLYTMFLLDRFFNKHNITYFAGSGTLLGIKRHKGHFIPYDDDIDLYVYERDRPRILALLDAAKKSKKSEFRKLRYGNKRVSVKVFTSRKRCHRWKKVIFCWPFVDLLPFRPVGKKSRVHKMMINGIEFNENQVFPLERATLDGIGVWIPKDWKFFIKRFGWENCCNGRLSHKRQKQDTCSFCVPCRCLRDWLHLADDLN